MKACTRVAAESVSIDRRIRRIWLGITVLDIYFVAAGEKVPDRYNIFVMCYHCHT